jgi:hypothetical protein
MYACCIDKSNSVELSEAINSMFRWYHNSVKCYVYLSDVATTGSAGIHKLFKESKWFTRGWTLQELLAPPCVEFFSKEGDRLGDRDSLAIQIAAITSIPAEALQGVPLSNIRVKERMSWARGRATKREEDIAYCQLGIFDIHMPLLYGEGEEKALKRLRKQIQESITDESHALSQGLPRQQQSRGYSDSEDRSRAQYNVVCYKCRYFQCITGNGASRANCHY